MGTQEPDKCMFCEEELEEWHYEYFQENGQRAEGSNLDICKDCIKKLNSMLSHLAESKSGDRE